MDGQRENENLITFALEKNDQYDPLIPQQDSIDEDRSSVSILQQSNLEIQIVTDKTPGFSNLTDQSELTKTQILENALFPMNPVLSATALKTQCLKKGRTISIDLYSQFPKEEFHYLLDREGIKPSSLYNQPK